jgi:TRAP transporter TAXI family solute receptor
MSGDSTGISHRAWGPTPTRSRSATSRLARAADAADTASGLIRRLIRTTVLAACAVAAGCSSQNSSTFLSIATGGTGGVYYPYGGGLAKVLNESLPNVRASAEVTAASVDNLKLIRDGKADVAFALTDTVADAVAGRAAFDGAPVPAATIAVLYSNYTHLVTLASTGINSVVDLRGKTVSTGSPGSGTEVIAFRILRAAGLDPGKDVTRQGLGASESADALKDGKVAAFFWSGGLPTAAVQDLSHSPGITIRMIATGDFVPALQKEFGELYFALDVPANAYPGVASTVSVVGVANALIVNRSMDEPLAYDITRVLFDKQRELAAIHPEARNLSLERATKGSPAPLHPGAARYYRERGIAIP